MTILPNSSERPPNQVAPYLQKDELALYRLIWQRFVASQMMPAVFDQTTIDISAGEKYTFRATGSVIKFDGFLAVYEEGKDEKDEDDEERAAKLPKVEKGEELKLNSLTPNQHFTEPPPRYTEATLVKALEEKGIGRPSTYASIMSVIQDREYVEKVEGKFRPTELGMIVNDLLVESFADLFNVQYTARMEEELDEVEDGKLAWTAALKEFYDKFTVDLKTAQSRMRDVKRQEILTDEVCDKCGSKMAIKFGRFGQFLACTNYPECKNTRELAKPAAANGEGAAEENPYADETCEKCQTHGAQARAVRPISRLHGLPRVQDHAQDHEIRRGRRPGDARREVSRMRLATGYKAGAVRRIHGLLAVPGLQIHQARDDGRAVSEARLQGRDSGQEVEARKNLLRLFRVSELRLRILGQARGRGLPAMRQALPARKIQRQEGRDGSLLLRGKLRLQDRQRRTGHGEETCGKEDRQTRRED